MIVQEDPFISLSNGRCAGSLVGLNRVSSESITGFGIPMGAKRRAGWHWTARSGVETPSDAPERPVATTDGLIAVTKLVVTGRSPSTGHQTPGPKGLSPNTSQARHSRLDCGWNGLLQGSLKGLLRLC